MAALLPEQYKHNAKLSTKFLPAKLKIRGDYILWRPTLDVGLIGWMRVHLGRVFPFTGQVLQSRPESHSSPEEQVSPI